MIKNVTILIDNIFYSFPKNEPIKQAKTAPVLTPQI